jgi:hypothetical protein
MSQDRKVRFELLLDRFLDDGRVVVINSSADGHPSPEHTTRALQGALDVPLGTVFTMLASREASGSEEEYVERPVGNVEVVAGGRN